MSEQPLTYESVLALIRESSREAEVRRAEFYQDLKEISREWKEAAREARETAREAKETAREEKERRAELDRQMKETDKKISALGSRIGEIVENMLGARIVDKFQALGYEVKRPVRNHYFSNSKLGISGEIDLVLYDGDVAILIEVKTKLETADVRRHMERMEKYRRYADARRDTTTRFIGAVAGAVVKEEAREFAHENGIYVIVQSGEAVEIVPVPEGFQVKEW